MVSETITAIFSAKETISDALNKASIASENFSDNIKEMNQAFGRAQRHAEFSEESLKEFKTQTNRLSLAMGRAKQQADEVSEEVSNLGHITDVTDAQIESLENSMGSLANANYRLNQSIDGVVSQQNQMIASSDLSEAQINQFRNATAQAVIPASRLAREINSVTTASAVSATAMQTAAGAADNMADQIDDIRNSSIGAAGALTTLNSVISDSILNFGSLSVNIGPFNIALRNFITQVPAILTGMGSMVSLITALIAGFGTLAVVSGALVAGGALQFFEEFSGNFEESTEAIEAMGAALRNLFVDALSPLMTDANADLFVDVVDGMASAVNRFAQFAQQMRDEVLSVFDQVEGDADKFFNALRITFVRLEPILVGIINFFTDDFAGILVRFGELTVNLAGDINTLINTFAALLNQLLDLASTILAGVAPAVRDLIGFLVVLVAIINRLPSGIISAAITAGIFSIALLKLTSTITGVIIALVNLNAAMLSAAAQGSFLAGTYTVLIAQTRALIAGKVSLIGALAAVRANMLRNIGIWTANTIAKVQNNLATTALSTALIKHLGIVQAVAAGNIGLIASLKLVTANMWNLIVATVAWAGKAAIGLITSLGASIAGMLGYGSATTFASGATWSLVGAIASLISPVLIVIGAIGALLALFGALANWIFGVGLFDIFLGTLEKIGDAIGWIVQKFKELIGLGGTGDLNADISGDEIETNPNVNLSFRDEVNQQVDVQADPEDREGLKRIVKDAMNEANSIARRSEGVGR